MSRSQITCPKCKTPLAVKHHGGRIVVLLGAIQWQALVLGGTELTCRCGEKRFVRIEALSDESKRAA